MHHATNENMADVMGWTLYENLIWLNEQGQNTGYFVNIETFKQEFRWNPIADLNHAALVEARLRELGLVLVYVEAIEHLIKEQAGKVYTWTLLTATAQTRCDAAWAAYQIWKEQRSDN